SVRGGPQGVGQTQIEETAKARPGLWKEKRVAFPGGRIGGVVWCWNHIVVAGENQRLLQRQKSFCVGDEPVPEGELVTVFPGLRRIAVRQIDRGDADDSIAVWDDRLDIARLLVVRAARKPRRGLDRRLGEYRH